MLRRTLALAAAVAALFVWPSCGGTDDETLKSEALTHIRTDLNGTWKGTWGAEAATLTFALGTPVIQMHKCASRGLIAAAYACLTTYTLPVEGTLEKGTAAKVTVSGTAQAYGSAGSIMLELTDPALNGDVLDGKLTGNSGGAAVSLTKQ